MTVTAPARPEPRRGPPAALRVAVALVAMLTVIIVGLAGLFALAASARTLTRPETRVGASTATGSQVVGVHEPVLAGQRRARAPCYDRTAVGSCVAAETEVGAVPRFIGNSAGDILDTSRVSIPEGKFGYLLENPSKAGVFSDSMGFDKAGLDSALRSHLIDNFGSASESVPMFGSGGAQIGTKFTVTGPLTGPSGATWNITSAWGVDWDGTTRLITATP